MNIDCDLHIHTIYSGHSSTDMSVGAIVHDAVEKGLRRIVILEHVPNIPADCPKVIAGEMHAATRTQIDAIAAEVDYWRGRVPLEILLGAEVDADPHLQDGTLLLKDLDGIDIILAATHFLPDVSAVWFQSPPVNDREKRIRLFEDWLSWIKKVARNPHVDVLAHPGVELATMSVIPAFVDDALSGMEELLRACLQGDTAFELNESIAFKLGSAQAETYVDVIALARDLGVKISPASDAHQLSRVGAFPWSNSVGTRLNLTEGHFFRPAMAI